MMCSVNFYEPPYYAQRDVYSLYQSFHERWRKQKMSPHVRRVDHGYFGQCEHCIDICLSRRIKQKKICKFKVELIYSSMSNEPPFPPPIPPLPYVSKRNATFSRFLCIYVCSILLFFRSRRQFTINNQQFETLQGLFNEVVHFCISHPALNKIQSSYLPEYTSI